MSIPEEIRAVPRPKNTVVFAYGKNKDRYGVKERIGCQRKNGKNYPVNGKVVGHIVDGKYVPKESTEDVKPVVSSSSIDLKDWAGESLVLEAADCLLDELREVYANEDALKIFCIAALRVLNPGIRDYQLSEKFQESFLSEFFPETPLSKNTVSTFQKNLGKTCSKIRQFMQNRTASIKVTDTILIDGTLKTCDSKINSLSEFSRKAKLKGRQDISVLFAFDMEKGEPVCSQVFPGNMLDLRAYESFVKDNGIKKGVVIGDKGFPSSSIEDILDKNSDLHYLNPLKRSSRVAKDHEMYSFEGVLPGEEGIQFKKAKVQGKNKWLYSFRTSQQAYQEEKDWIKNARKKGTYSDEEYRKKKEVFGTIVFESDLDLAPEMVYRMYSERWGIEVVMGYYKNALDFDDTRVHDDYSVIGSEFIDFISTLITFKLLKKFDETKLLDDFNYGTLMRILKQAKKVKVDGNWELIRLNANRIKVLELLGVLPTAEEPPVKKRGRPRKQPAA